MAFLCKQRKLVDPGGRLVSKVTGTKHGGHERFFWVEGLPTIYDAEYVPAPYRLRWNKKADRGGKADIVQAIELAPDCNGRGSAAWSRISEDDIARGLVIGIVGGDLAVVFADAETRRRWTVGLTALIDFANMPKPLAMRRLRTVWVEKLVVAAEMQRAFEDIKLGREGMRAWMDAQTRAADFELQHLQRLGLSAAASEREIEEAEQEAQLAAHAQAQGLVQLKVKPTVKVSAETERAMTGTGTGLAAVPPDLSSIVWLYDDGAGGWGMFEPAAMVAVLEQARRLGQGGAVEVKSADFGYIVDLDRMEQENQMTGTVRKVQRLDTSDAEPEPEWEPEPDAGDDGEECSICFTNPREWGMSRFGCPHHYCGECIRGTLNAALDTGDFPARCPECKMANAPGEPPPGVVDEEALTFLQQKGVIDQPFAIRFAALGSQAQGDEKTFACPAGCGRMLVVVPPTYNIDPKSGAFAIQLGQCPCLAKVCTLCHKQETGPHHECEMDQKRVDALAAKAGAAPVDQASEQYMAKIGKKCPACGMFISKTWGCDMMMCGSSAHSSEDKALRMGGCGHEFMMATLAPVHHGSPGHPSNERQILFGQYTGPPKTAKYDQANQVRAAEGEKSEQQLRLKALQKEEAKKAKAAAKVLPPPPPKQ
jgi:hypothetical protein